MDKIARTIAVFVPLCCAWNANAQIAPPTSTQTGGNGLASAVSATGGYGASLPFDFPAARGGLPVPAAVVGGGRRFGAAGLGWDVPLSFIQHSGSMAHQRPIPQSTFSVGGAPLANNDRMTMVLLGSAIELVPNPSGDGWLARHDPQVEVHQTDAVTLVMYDGNGRKYTFGGSAGYVNHGAMFLLTTISGPGGNTVGLRYSIDGPTLPDGSFGVSINLISVDYNSHPTTSNCFKNRVSLNYDAAVSPPAAMSVLGGSPGNTHAILARTKKLTSVTVNSHADCSGTWTPLRTYSFTYGQDADTGLAQLSSVKMTGQQGTTEASVSLRIADYTYSSLLGGTNVAGAPAVGWAWGGDMGVPGLPSSMATVNGTTQTATSSGNFLDLNGDGLPDFFLQGTGTYTNSGGTSFAAPTGMMGTFVPVSVTSPVGAAYARKDNTTDVLSQYIDINGDGRVDFIDAGVDKDHWILHLNTPDATNPANVVWKTVSLSTANVRQALLAQGFAGLDSYTPLSRTRTVHDQTFAHCWQPDSWSSPTSWVTYFFGWLHSSLDHSNECKFSYYPRQHDTATDLPSGTYGSIAGAENTITEWTLRDVNGDGYPDFLLVNGDVAPATDNPTPPTVSLQDFIALGGEDKVTTSASPARLSGTDALALMNTAGVHLADGMTVFASPISLFNNQDGCGLERWQEDTINIGEGSATNLVCGFQDINGDGILDRFTSTRNGNALLTTVRLGTGDASDPFSYRTGGQAAQITLPGPPARRELKVTWDGTQGLYVPTQCVQGASTFDTHFRGGLVDFNGDGIPDYVTHVGSTRTDQAPWTIAFGTGTGFTASLPLVAFGNANPNLELTVESNACNPPPTGSAQTPVSTTTTGLFDIDGDSLPELITVDTNHPGFCIVSSLGGVNGTAPGRLAQFTDGFTHVSIAYTSAKRDTTTPHIVPFPEIVVQSITVQDQSGGMPVRPTYFGYGTARLLFDPDADSFTFPAYGRRTQSQKTIVSDDISALDTVVTVTDTYAATPFDGGASAAARMKRMLLAGRVSDQTQVALASGGALGASLPLNADLSQITARFSGAHYDYDVHTLPSGTAVSGNEACIDVDPYNYATNASSDDQCLTRGFMFGKSTIAWRGTPPTGSLVPAASGTVVETDTEVQTVDDLGHVTQVTQLNDASRNDDDVCASVSFAAPQSPTGAPRVLNAVSERTLTNCASPAVTLSHETWEYDGLTSGVGSGFTTGHIVSRLDATGAPLPDAAGQSDIRQFTAAYDTLGNVTTLTRLRDDGSLSEKDFAYDPSQEPFKLAPTSVFVSAINGDPTAPPVMSQTVQFAYDPLSLTVTNVTDPNGTQRGTTYDGFGRRVLTTLTPPGGAVGALSSTSFVGFGVGQTGPRKIIATEFTDAVPLSSVGTATGLTSTTVLDDMGRQSEIDVNLGGDYGNQIVVMGRRVYDTNIGRLVYEADPYPSSQSSSTAYGTSLYYNIDGTPYCKLRGNGQQNRPHSGVNVTNESQELYQTNYTAGVAGGQWVVGFINADANLNGSPQYGVVTTTAYSATGRPLTRATTQNGTNLDLVSIAHDTLGRMTSMTRYHDPATQSNPVTTTWHYDSFGNLIELDVPDSSPQFRTFDDWGELTQVQWTDSTAAGIDRRSINRFDALGRVVHREDRTSGNVEPRTVNDLVYDVGVDNATPAVTAVNVLGRLAKATSPTSSVSFSYSSLGLNAASVYTDLTVPPGDPNSVFVEKHSYHSDGSLAALDLLLPDTEYVDENVSYTQDTAGRGRTVTYSDGTITKTLFSASGTGAIDALGRVRNAQYGAATLSATFGDTGRRLIQDMSVASPSATAREISFAPIAGTTGATAAFDPIGRERVRQEFKDGTALTPRTNEYDSLGRVQYGKVASPLTTERTFLYDALGNITKQLNAVDSSSTVTLTYEMRAGHDLDRVCNVVWGTASPGDGCNVAYDGMGNITHEPTQANGERVFSYFPNGQVSDIVNGATQASFDYDAFGAVQRLIVNTMTSADSRQDKHFGMIYLRKEDGKIVATRSIPGPGGMIAARHGTGASSPWTFTFGEDRGTRFVADQDGKFVQDIDYQAFGDIRSSSGAAAGTAQYQNRQWNGGDLLAAVGVVQLGARIYDPAIGRFLSRDPLVLPRTGSTTNPYAFANNDPINGSDPTGLCSKDDVHCILQNEGKGSDSGNTGGSPPGQWVDDGGGQTGNTGQGDGAGSGNGGKPKGGGNGSGNSGGSNNPVPPVGGSPPGLNAVERAAWLTGHFCGDGFTTCDAKRLSNFPTDSATYWFWRAYKEEVEKLRDEYQRRDIEERTQWVCSRGMPHCTKTINPGKSYYTTGALLAVGALAGIPPIPTATALPPVGFATFGTGAVVALPTAVRIVSGAWAIEGAYSGFLDGRHDALANGNRAANFTTGVVREVVEGTAHGGTAAGGTQAALEGGFKGITGNGIMKGVLRQSAINAGFYSLGFGITVYWGQ
jgi:RHS repeat-associated protein